MVRPADSGRRVAVGAVRSDESALRQVLQVREHGKPRGGAQGRGQTFIDMGGDRLDRSIACRNAR